MMKIAVEGCCHGELDRIYQTLEKVQEREGWRVDLLICCGDFQAVRNTADLECMAVPHKYRKMNSFYKYYSGEKTAPILTIFIGGNHEASNYLWELSLGGWVAPNIYYLGNAGCVQFGGLRIAGLSGIYKSGDYGKGHFEFPPYTEQTKRSAYHVRSCDVFRLKQLSGHIDIMLSHDWPRGIHSHGNQQELLRRKPYFAQDIANGELGSPPAMELLTQQMPDYWFSAHLHVKFPALVHHESQGSKVTRFLSLDKCLPRRKCLQILDISSSTSPEPLASPPSLCYDREWLAILRSTEPLMRYSRSLWLPPPPSTSQRHSFTPTQADLEKIDKLLAGDLTIPLNFSPTSPPTLPHTQSSRPPLHSTPVALQNPQTEALCKKLGMRNPFTPDFLSLSHKPSYWSNPEEIALDSSSSGDEVDTAMTTVSLATSSSSKSRYPWLDYESDERGGEGMEGGEGACVSNPDEILLSDDGSDEERDQGVKESGESGEVAALAQHNPDEIVLSDSSEEGDGGEGVEGDGGEGVEGDGGDGVVGDGGEVVEGDGGEGVEGDGGDGVVGDGGEVVEGSSDKGVISDDGERVEGDSGKRMDGDGGEGVDGDGEGVGCGSGEGVEGDGGEGVEGDGGEGVEGDGGEGVEGDGGEGMASDGDGVESDGDEGGGG